MQNAASRRPDIATEAAVVCTGLEKVYRDFWGRARPPALRGIDLRVEAGASHAILGPNGSGKTTTLRILLGLLRPTRGEVRIFGRDPTSPGARRGVGFLPETTSLPAFLTCAETLDVFARLHALSGADARRRGALLLDRVDLAAAAKRRVRELSLGMRRRLALAVALVAEPRLLVLDEPTAGMDPIARESVLGLFREHVARGGTLLVTSHLLGDLSGIATSATLLAGGAVARRGELADLLAVPGERVYRVAGGPELDARVRAAVEGAGGRVLAAEPARATIEELFVETFRSGRRDPDAGVRDPGAHGDGAREDGRAPADRGR